MGQLLEPGDARVGNARLVQIERFEAAHRLQMRRLCTCDPARDVPTTAATESHGTPTRCAGAPGACYYRLVFTVARSNSEGTTSSKGCRPVANSSSFMVRSV